MQESRSYHEAAEFIADVNPEHVLKFKASEQASQRFENLVMKKKSGSLTNEENEELAMLVHMEYLMSLAKAKARAKIHHA
jgi:hypothetical protein